MNSKQPSKPPLNILSIDGGGIRGLSAIMVLQEIMRLVNRDRKVSGQEPVQPWQYFDMIGGTSTGGIIAIMLGRLHMTLEDCEKAYSDLGKEIFTPKKAKFSPGKVADFLNARGKFDATQLEEAVKNIIQRTVLGSSAEAMLMEEDPTCKVIAFATNAYNASPTFLRNFETEMADFISRDMMIWEACRATSAATTFFDSFQFEKHDITFLDGALRYNNPVQCVYNEAAELWPDRKDNILLISIGTGSAPKIPLGGPLHDIAKGIASLVTDTEQEANDFYRSHQKMAEESMYFRFNVTGMEDIGLEEYKRINEIRSSTQHYLQGARLGAETKTCVGMLLRKGTIPS